MNRAMKLALVMICATAVSNLATQERPAPDKILSMTADNGRRVFAALGEYTYYAELTLETVSDADIVTGTYHRFSQISFDSTGKRQEKIFEDKSTLPKDAYISSNAANNLTRVYQFIITPETFSEYEMNYVGRERVDELDTYVFDVKPKVKMPDPEKSTDRYLKGRVWIDDRDLQVVKVTGEALPEQRAHRTPRFETIFQNHDEYWFPAYTSADDSIRVGRRQTRVIVTVRFTGYRKANQ